MTTLLQINSSLFGAQGASSQLADAYVARLQGREPGLRLIRRDLSANPIPHLDAQRLEALGTPVASRTAVQRRIGAEADALVAELKDADVLVLGAPMYNFAVPSQLKAWFDHIARAGLTFRYTEAGPEGLLTGKRAVVFTSRGGVHRDQPEDGVVPYVRTMLNFVGITDIEFVYAEGLALGAEPRQQALDAARAQIETLLAA